MGLSLAELVSSSQQPRVPSRGETKARKRRGCGTSQAPGIQTSLKTPAGPQPVSQNYSQVPQGLSKYSFQPLSPGVPGRGSVPWGWEAVVPWEPREWPLQGAACPRQPHPASSGQPPGRCSRLPGPRWGQDPAWTPSFTTGTIWLKELKEPSGQLAGRGHTAVGI